MARSKPNKPKSPHKQQIEEQNKKDKTETTPHITSQTSKPSKTANGVEAQSTKSSTPFEAYIWNPENIPYYDGDTLDRRIYQRDRNKRTKKSKEKEWPLPKRLQAKKTASHQSNRKLNKSPYLPSSQETDSVSDKMNRKQ
jgi:hypothetical protein